MHAKDEKGLIFYYEKIASDLFPILQDYFTSNPYPIQTIGVQDPTDFVELVDKTAPIIGFEKPGWKNMGKKIGGPVALRHYLGRTNDALKPGCKALNLDRIERAYRNIPAQVGSNECGVNTGARALVLAGANINENNYEPFVNKCPTIGNTINKVSEITANTGVKGFLLGLGLSLIPGGAAIGVPLAFASGGTAALGAVGKNCIPISAKSFPIDPWYLSKHTDNYLPRTYKYSRVNCYNDFSKCTAAILQDISLGDPVIAVFIFAPLKGHYANVVGVKKGPSERVDEFIMLETGQYFESLSYREMEFLMKNQYKHMTTLGLWNKPNYDYYLIRFYKK